MDGLNLREENQKLHIMEGHLDERTRAGRRIPPPHPPHAVMEHCKAQPRLMLSA